MNRNRFIDFLKGIGILGVLTIHSLLLVPEDSAEYGTAIWIDSFFRFAVPFFIAVLGYMTIEKYRDITSWGTFHLQKTEQLVLPYVAWSFIYMLTPDIFADFEQLRSLKGFILGYTEVHFYYLIAYFSILLVTPLLIGGVRNFPRDTQLLVLLTLIGLHLWILYRMEAAILSHQFDSFYIQTQSRLPIHWLSFYASGMIMALYQEQIHSWVNRYRWIPFLFPVMLFLYVLMVSDIINKQKYLYIYYTPTLFFLSVSAFLLFGILFLALRKFKLCRGIEYIGKHSFPVYLSHVFWIKIVFLFVFEKKVTFMNVWLLWLISLAGSVLYVIVHHRISKLSVNMMKTRLRIREMDK